MDVEGLKCTPTALDVNVTSPPPYVLYTIPPSTVAIAVASAGALGGTTIVVASGTVLAVICSDSSELMADCWFAAVVVVLELCRLMAMCTSFVATTGSSEWTCSRAERSLEKTPS